jgi:hypothetical protein
MNKETTILGLIFLAGIILCSLNGVSASSQCCVIHNSKCTFWDMGDWTNGQAFCEGLPKADPYFHTSYYSDSCTSISPSLPTCTDGFIVCGDNQCSFPETCASCSKDCGVCEGENQCTPRWKCGEWSNCTSSGTQTRTCTNSRFTCNRDKPAESQSCTYIAPPKPVEKQAVQNTTNAEVAEETNDAAPIQDNAQDTNSNPGITGNAIKTTEGLGANTAIIVALVIGAIAVIFFVLRFTIN